MYKVTTGNHELDIEILDDLEQQGRGQLIAQLDNHLRFVLLPDTDSSELYIAVEKRIGEDCMGVTIWQEIDTDRPWGEIAKYFFREGVSVYTAKDVLPTEANYRDAEAAIRRRVRGLSEVTE